MEKLLLVGNGFDLGLGLQTSYKDFRRYLVKTYLIDEDVLSENELSETDVLDNYIVDSYLFSGELWEAIESSRAGNHGGIDFDQAFVAKYTVYLFDECGNPAEAWSDLENDLAFVDVQELLEAIDQNNDLYDIQNFQDSIAAAVKELHRGILFLFQAWVGTINLNKIANKNRQKYQARVNASKYFLTFNYTSTLEVIFEVPFKEIEYIHGYVKDPQSIMFGCDIHKIKDDGSGHDALSNDTLRTMEKDVLGNVISKESVWDRLKNVSEVNSIGFSFGDIDMPYIDGLFRYIENSNLTWVVDNYQEKKFEEICNKLNESWRKLGKNKGGLTVRLSNNELDNLNG